MIRKDLETAILRKFNQEKWTIGTICAEFRVHHSTVERVLRDNDARERMRRPLRSSLEVWLPMIEEYLGKFPNLCASRLFQMAVERGHRGSEDHFRHYVAHFRPRKPGEAFMPLRTLPGEQGQVDWGHFGTVQVGKAERRLVAFVLVLSYSRRIFLRFGFDMRMSGFLDGHQRAFEHFGGIPRVLLYDNLKSAVVERMGDIIQLHPAMLTFSSWHGYEPRPVAVARGNETGRVERSIRYIRTNFFEARKWKDLDDLNAQALHWCDEIAAARPWPQDRSRRVHEAIAEETPTLLPLPADRFPCEDRREVHSQKMPYIRYDLNDYSVPHTHVQRTLTVFATPDRVRIVHGDTVIASHPRSYDKAKTVEDPAHLADLVKAKRHAKRHRAQDRLIAVVPQTSEILTQLSVRGDGMRSGAAYLQKLLDRYGLADFTEAVALAVAAKTPHPNNIRLLCERIRHRRGLGDVPTAPLVTAPHLLALQVKPHNLNTYDRLGAAQPGKKPKMEDNDE